MHILLFRYTGPLWGLVKYRPHVGHAVACSKNTGHQMVYLPCVCLAAQSCPTLSPRGLSPARLLCPRGFCRKNTGVGCHALLQGIFPTPGLNSGLPNCRQILYHLSSQGSPTAFLFISPLLPCPFRWVTECWSLLMRLNGLQIHFNY